MNRFKAVAGLSIVALAVAVAYQCRQWNALAQTPDPPKLQTSRTVEQNRSLGEIISALEEAAAKPDAKASDELSRDLIALMGKDAAGSPEDAVLRRRAVILLAERVPSPESKAFILGILDNGPQDLREAAAAHVGSPRGVQGPSVYAEILKLADKDLLPDEILPQALRRAGGRKAREVLMTLMRSTDSAKLTAGCAVALQDYQDPRVMGDILETLEQKGLLDSSAKLPWLSPSLLDAHMKTADHAQFRRGLIVMAARPRLARIEHLRRGLESDDEATRNLAAAAVKKAALGKFIDPAQGEALLAQTKTSRP